MKTRTLKTSVGIVAVAALVGMNLFHAWNNYGIKDSSMLLSIKATPAEDSTEVKCDTKPGSKTVYNSELSTSVSKNNSTMCKITEEFEHYKIIDKKEVIIGKTIFDYTTGRSEPKEITNGYSYGDLAHSLRRTINCETETLPNIEISCSKYCENHCCYGDQEEKISGCEALYKYRTK
ncbi:MAG: hypothetical protein J6B92_01405 [Paraprevotella sp.]|nr:hypothetical protein [Paraprevotella sp.]MBP3471513.1 hypothetical protein [Paraprevotella sp.]